MKEEMKITINKMHDLCMTETVIKDVVSMLTASNEARLEYLKLREHLKEREARILRREMAMVMIYKLPLTVICAHKPTRTGSSQRRVKIGQDDVTAAPPFLPGPSGLRREGRGESRGCHLDVFVTNRF